MDSTVYTKTMEYFSFHLFQNVLVEIFLITQHAIYDSFLKFIHHLCKCTICKFNQLCVDNTNYTEYRIVLITSQQVANLLKVVLIQVARVTSISKYLGIKHVVRSKKTFFTNLAC